MHLALRDEEAIRSLTFLDESTNDEKSSTEMKLYEEGDDTEAEDEIIVDEKAILGNPVHCVLNNYFSTIRFKESSSYICSFYGNFPRASGGRRSSGRKPGVRVTNTIADYRVEKF